MFSTIKRNSRLALRASRGRAAAIVLICFAAAVFTRLVLYFVTSIFGPANPSDLAETLPGSRGEQLLQAMLATSPQRLVFLGVNGLIRLLALAPLRLGLLRWFRALVHGKSLPAGELFHFFERAAAYRAAVLYTVNLWVRSLLWALLFLLPPAAMLYASIRYLGGQEARAALTFGTFGVALSCALLFFAQLACVIFLNRYMLVGYLLCEDERRGVRQAFRLSVKYSATYRLPYFGFCLSFTGWVLLSIVTLGFGFLYTVPYLGTACAMYGRYVIEKNRYIEASGTREFSIEGADGPGAGHGAGKAPDTQA